MVQPFILPVNYNHFSYFIVIPFFWEIKTFCCCSSNYNNDNDDNDATMVTSYWETVEITFENLLCNLIFHRQNLEWRLYVDISNNEMFWYTQCSSKIRGHCIEVPCARIKRPTSTYSHKYVYVFLVWAFVIHCSTCALSGTEL